MIAIPTMFKNQPTMFKNLLANYRNLNNKNPKYIGDKLIQDYYNVYNFPYLLCLIRIINNSF